MAQLIKHAKHGNESMIWKVPLFILSNKTIGAK